MVGVGEDVWGWGRMCGGGCVEDDVSSCWREVVTERDIKGKW